MTAAYMTDKAIAETEEMFRVRRRAVVLLDIIAAEFASDPMSVRCFDSRIVEEAIAVSKQLKRFDSKGILV